MESHPWMQYSMLRDGGKVGMGHRLDWMALEGFSNLNNSLILQFQPVTPKPAQRDTALGAASASKHKHWEGLSPGKGEFSNLWNSCFSKEKPESCRNDSFLGRIPSSSSVPSLISQEAALQHSLHPIKTF